MIVVLLERFKICRVFVELVIKIARIAFQGPKISTAANAKVVKKKMIQAFRKVQSIV